MLRSLEGEQHAETHKLRKTAAQSQVCALSLSFFVKFVSWVFRFFFFGTVRSHLHLHLAAAANF